MKLQYLIVIFIIIIIPIALIFAYYLNLQAETVRIQTDYDEKLQEATNEMMEAYELNTTEWSSEYSTLANVKRRDIMASINVFTTSLSNKLGVGGSAKENILNYVPAIVYIMYDGYYIYTPAYVPETVTDEGIQLFYYKDANEGRGESKVKNTATQTIDSNTVSGETMYELQEGVSHLHAQYDGKELNFTTDVNKSKKTYKHVLKTFVPYTTTKKIGDKTYTINYTLDNYIRIYGKDFQLEGYINFSENVEGTDRRYLTETIMYKDELGDDLKKGEFIYIYNSNGEKRYYDEVEDNYFVLNANGMRYFLPMVITKDGEEDTWIYNVNDAELEDSYGATSEESHIDRISLKAEQYCDDKNAEYKQAIYIGSSAERGTYKQEEYVLLNKTYKNGTRNLYRYQYNEENNRYERMTMRVSGKLRFNRSNVDLKMDRYYRDHYYDAYFLNLDLRNEIKNAGVLNSVEIDKIIKGIYDERESCIIENINNNLKLSIANYSANSKINYRLPELTDEDWEQALSNISVITFFQGVKIGLKTYNNYCVVTCPENNEFTGEDNLYYIVTNDGTDGNYHETDGYYHEFGCDKIKYDATSHIVSYRTSEFTIPQYYEKNGVQYNYYKHQYKDSEGNSKTYQPCYYCILNKNKKTECDEACYNKYVYARYTTYGREQYVQIFRTRLTY